VYCLHPLQIGVLLTCAGRTPSATPTWLLYQSPVGFLLSHVKLFQSIAIGVLLTCTGRRGLRPLHGCYVNHKLVFDSHLIFNLPTAIGLPLACIVFIHCKSVFNPRIAIGSQLKCRGRSPLRPAQYKKINISKNSTTALNGITATPYINYGKFNF